MNDHTIQRTPDNFAPCEVAALDQGEAALYELDELAAKRAEVNARIVTICGDTAAHLGAVRGHTLAFRQARAEVVEELVAHIEDCGPGVAA